MNARVDCLLDSDMSSEMVLSRLLASQKSILTKDWFYSTELRVVNMQLAFTAAFLFLKSWHAVRILSGALMYLMMLAGYYYLCRQVKCREYFALTGAFLLLPFSAGYFDYILLGLCYIFPITISFLTIGMLFQCLRSSGRRKKGIFAIASVLAVIAGTNGERQLVILYLPLVLSAAVLLFAEWKKEHSLPQKSGLSFQYAYMTVVLLVCAAVGYLINSRILAPRYHFQSWGNLYYKELDMETLFQVINGFFNSFGYSEGMVFSAATIRNGICFVLVAVTILCVVRGIRRKAEVSLENYLLSLFFVCAVVIFAVLYAFVSVRYIDRYNLPILVFAFLIMALNVRDISWEKKWKELSCAAVTAILLLSSVITYRSYAQLDYTGELRDIVALLNQSGYEEGYATFWNANVLTELADGKIDVRDWCDGNETSMSMVSDVNQTYEWLQLTSHKETVPTGQVFLLFRPFERDASCWKENLQAENVLYESSEYVVYGYSDYAAMTSAIYGKTSK